MVLNTTAKQPLKAQGGHATQVPLEGKQAPWVSIPCQQCQSYLTLCDPVDCSPPGSSVHGILQARTLEWVAMPFSRGSSQHRNRTHISWIGRRILYHMSHQRTAWFITQTRILERGRGWADQLGPGQGVLAVTILGKQEAAMIIHETAGWHHDYSWHGWMASPTQRTWVWVNSRRW